MKTSQEFPVTESTYWKEYPVLSRIPFLFQEPIALFFYKWKRDKGVSRNIDHCLLDVGVLGVDKEQELTKNEQAF